MNDWKCHLWNMKDLTAEDLQNSLEKVKSYEEESHLIRMLKKCTTCGQLFFYEFFEEVDWAGGNDPQRRTWIPVENEKDADEINQKTSPDLLGGFPRIIQEWPSDEDRPRKPQKILL